MSKPPDDISAVIGAPDQRWITALGSYDGNTASLQAELTTGGRFNRSEPVAERNTEDGLEFLKHHPVSYPVLANPEGNIGIPYGIRTLPRSFLLDRNGQIIASCRSFIAGDEIDLQQAIEELVNTMVSSCPTRWCLRGGVVRHHMAIHAPATATSSTRMNAGLLPACDWRMMPEPPYTLGILGLRRHQFDYAWDQGPMTKPSEDGVASPRQTGDRGNTGVKFKL